MPDCGRSATLTSRPQAVSQQRLTLALMVSFPGDAFSRAHLLPPWLGVQSHSPSEMMRMKSKGAWIFAPSLTYCPKRCFPA